MIAIEPTLLFLVMKIFLCIPCVILEVYYITGSVEVAKQDLIEELKKSKDITGIKKMKVEKVKMEEQHEKELVSEISKQLSVDSFVGKVSC